MKSAFCWELPMTGMKQEVSAYGIANSLGIGHWFHYVNLRRGFKSYCIFSQSMTIKIEGKGFSHVDISSTYPRLEP